MAPQAPPGLPLILSPAGEKDSFLAALSAGADAIYCGLASFSARMKAKNFSIHELAGLTELAHEKGAGVYVAFNSILKPDELSRAGELIRRLQKEVRPDALIVSDPATPALARRAGFRGEIHLSTLANLSFPAGLAAARENLGVCRAVIPRELGVDEIRDMAAACPRGLDLEVFVHGALCYGVSGRCYWSSYMGGKSGLRGRCVQPCRRLYRQGEAKKRCFSSRDLSLDVLTKVLLEIPRIRAWKIEGRKKGPHYVFCATKAYKILRDSPRDPRAAREAMDLLGRSLGRTGSHYFFLPQRPHNPIDREGETASGLFAGRTKGGPGNVFLKPRFPLFAGDILRAGYEDESFHRIVHVTRYVPKQGRLPLAGAFGKGAGKKGPFKKEQAKKGRAPKKQAPGGPVKSVPVFLVDRREKELAGMIAALEKEIPKIQAPPKPSGAFSLSFPKKKKTTRKILDMAVFRRVSKKTAFPAGFWMPEGGGKALSSLVSRVGKQYGRRGVWWWLPPVIWPAEEKKIREGVGRLLKSGFSGFVLNAPWQTALFPKKRKLHFWAGPFCNLANPLAVQAAADMGFSGAVVSPELAAGDFMALPAQSPIPLGIVLHGNFPLCVSRNLSEDLNPARPFLSPKNEGAWVTKHGESHWVFPNWALDLRARKKALQRAGYVMFVYLNEPVLKGVKMLERPGAWNWDGTLY
ncbi:Peptidase U32 [Candidatus Desulfarcum epimagneticum]|uniref:Peptidase U32 n=1 Tax=uncultured Desulfobacteraceae bacterium TaxID=218296 RepID=A0A484HHD9_9BACT|nr:Peptidase U32 [uncultured Desulfobacteraceae bacterium]